MSGPELILSVSRIEQWLRTSEAQALDALWRRADAVRAATVGNAVHLRGLVEIGNHCIRRCTYCGLNAAHAALERYRMNREQILDVALQIADRGYGTIVIQGGEDPGIEADWLAEIIAEIKQRMPLAVTLSLGERAEAELACWRRAGADRYLLRWETSDADLYRAIHPPGPSWTGTRIELLAVLRRLGYEIGGGVMVGLPGQTWASLARDITLFAELDLDMIGLGPYIPHPDTPLGRGQVELPPIDPADQVPGTDAMTYKVLALARIVCPEANIPATTALATVDPNHGRALALQRGANVIMPDFTPEPYRSQYQIYPGKSSAATTDAGQGIERLIRQLGRTVGIGPGGRQRRSQARA